MDNDEVLFKFKKYATPILVSKARAEQLIKKNKGNYYNATVNGSAPNSGATPKTTTKTVGSTPVVVAGGSTPTGSTPTGSTPTGSAPSGVANF